ncbi:MAG: VOC family protein [Phycisphaerales bacterium]|nr:VOC family protein [Phycisphaerales bacterium]
MLRGGTTTIYVADMDRAVDFYTKTLGLTQTYRAGNEWCAVDAGNGMQLGLHPAGERSPKPGSNGGTIVGFNVTAPMDDVVSGLRAKGVRFKGPIVDDANGSIRLAFFSDPDGNDLYLCESKWQGPAH